MALPLLHRFELEDRCFVMDTHTCFCFECDRITWDVLEFYPREPINRIYHLLRDTYPRQELEEVVGELEWLRVTGAILTRQNDQEFFEQATRAGGLRQVALSLKGGGGSSWAGAAAQCLLARSGSEQELTLTLYLEDAAPREWTSEATALDEARRIARLAGKCLRVVVDLPFQPLPEAAAATAGCRFRCRLSLADNDGLAAALADTARLGGGKPRAALETFRQRHAPEGVQIVAQPQSERFHAALETLHQAGYADMTLDVPGAWAAHPRMEPEGVTDALRANAAYYADQLLKNNLFRAEPLAFLFNAIYNGTPCYRTDASGVESLAVDSAGDVYPALVFTGNPEYRLGSLADGTLDEVRREPFILSGALQIPACLRCWARGLCGGGHSAIHYARTGGVRTPDDVWCDAQRRWIGIAVATFNRISAAGINFSHLAAALQPRKQRISLFTAARALIQGRLGVRPLREDDAPWLVRWENWNRAAYFVCNEAGALLATQYDREMDALHPNEFTRELALTDRDGAPCGLIRMRPEPARSLIWAWLYMRDGTQYAKSALRHTLRDLLAEIGKSRQVRHILMPVTEAETELAEALLAVGFVHAGTERKALFQRNAYQDVAIYAYAARE